MCDERCVSGDGDPAEILKRSCLLPGALTIETLCPA